MDREYRYFRSMSDPVRIVLRCSEPHSGKLHVEIIDPAPPADLKLEVVKWRPGRYSNQDFPPLFSEIAAEQADQPLEVSLVGPRHIQLGNRAAAPLTLRYRVMSMPLDAGSTTISPDLIQINPFTCLLWDRDWAKQSFRLEVAFPPGRTFVMAGDGSLPRTFDSWDELVDAPIYWNMMQTHSFQVDAASYTLQLHHDQPVDTGRLETLIRNVAKVQADTFQQPLPEHYHFALLNPSYTSYHGVEHADGNIIVYRDAEPWMDGGYEKLQSIISHEHFHLWNVKRMRPDVLWQFDYAKEPVSELYYIAEGFTSYFGDLTLLQSGGWDLDTYVRNLQQKLQADWQSPASERCSLADGSRRSFSHGYRPHFLGAMTNFYNRGELVGLALDLALMEQGQRLSTFMAQLYAGSASQKRGYSTTMVEEILHGLGGSDTVRLWRSLVYDVGRPPMAEHLATVGMTMDIGAESRVPMTVLGLELQETGVVKKIKRPSQLFFSELQPGDGITQINEESVNTPAEIESKINALSEGSPLTLTVSRRGETRRIHTLIESLSQPKVTVTLDASAGASAIEKRAQWMAAPSSSWSAKP